MSHVSAEGAKGISRSTRWIRAGDTTAVEKHRCEFGRRRIAVSTAVTRPTTTASRTQTARSQSEATPGSAIRRWALRPLTRPATC